MTRQPKAASRVASQQHPTEGMTEAELADYYGRTHDLSEFVSSPSQPNEAAGPEPSAERALRRNVFSVRMSADELDAVLAAAREAGVKPGTFIREAAVAAANMVDDRDDDALVIDMLDALRRQIERARQHRAERDARDQTG